MSPTSLMPEPLHPEHLTWTSLLGHWMNFARAAVALPKDGDGPRWRASVPVIIDLQAVTFALGNLDQLAADERALALDRAELLIASASDELRRIWLAADQSTSLNELIHDARTALESARQSHHADPVTKKPLI